VSIEISGSVLEFQPTWSNYSVSFQSIGTTRRTLGGSLRVHSVAVKKKWEITVPEQGLSAVPPGTPFSFKDFDGASYQVVMTELPVKNRPELAEVTLTLEEI